MYSMVTKVNNTILCVYTHIHTHNDHVTRLVGY